MIKKLKEKRFDIKEIIEIIGFSEEEIKNIK